MYPAAYPEAIAVAARRQRPLAPLVRQHRQLPRRLGSRRRHRVALGLVAHGLRRRQRHLDGDAVRLGRSCTHHRGEPHGLRGTGDALIEGTATEPRPEPTLFGHGLINPAARRCSPRSRTRRASRLRAMATGSSAPTAGCVRSARRAFYGDLGGRSPQRTDRRFGADP